VYVITGESGTGMTHAVTAARLLSDLIAGRPNELAAVFDPTRLRLGATPEYLRENLNVAAQYADWLAPGDVASADDVAPDSGAIVRRGTRKLAVFRDATGALHQFSAACTHLGCLVRWHAAERTWDCPCHGSRYDALGHVISGPAVENLRPVEPD
jgi:nitrite reductase/ring-hydroxylating ferredoxin subunit